MKLKLLPSSFERDGSASQRQHLTCFLINGKVAIDAGSLAMAVTKEERSMIKDVVITHGHLDHIAGLPLFIDDQFSELSEPIRVHATSEVAEGLERDVFNWSVYPRFSELTNKHGRVMEYCVFQRGEVFTIDELTFRPIEVNHKVPCSGFIISEGLDSIAITGDTAKMNDFWDNVNGTDLRALLIECAFPDELAELAEISYHLTPSSLASELRKFRNPNCDVLVVNLKPSYREVILKQIADLRLKNLSAMKVGADYEWKQGSLHEAT